MSAESYLDKLTKENVKEMTLEEVNLAFDQLAFQETTERKREKILEYLDVEESKDGNIIKTGTVVG